MVIEAAQPSVVRLPQLAGIETPPELFFAINDGKHPHSVYIIEQLVHLYTQEPIPGIRATFGIFTTWEDIPSDIPANSVLIFDAPLGKNCFSSLRWNAGVNKREFPHEKQVKILWGFAVNTNLRMQRIVSAAYQLRADFGKNFLSRLDNGKFPWGDAPTQKIKKEQRKRKSKRNYEEYLCHQGW